MKVYNPQNNALLHQDLVHSLELLRAKRSFNTEKYIEKKTEIINRYLRNSNLKSCLVAVSGGVDSAVTLALVHKASQKDGSPIKKIIAALLPVFSKDGATNQKEALERGIEVVRTFGIEPTIIDLTKIHSTLKHAVDNGLGLAGKAWAEGQLVAYTRTPALYYITSLLSEEGNNGVLCGTTNRDEGAYLGYVGKASDGMVDVQIISDLHKSEVYKVAKVLEVPNSSINAIPTGDMYDGRTDEQVFGAPYDFVELYLLYLSLCDEQEQTRLINSWSSDGRIQFCQLKERIESLHNYNKHKYVARSPAIHLNILPSNVPGGWQNQSPYGE